MTILNEIEYKSISALKENSIYKFYSTAFPLKNEVLYKNWRWIYRTSFNNLEPIVATHKDKIIGHAGLISNKLSFNNSFFNGIWFVDFFILPEFRNIGLGKILTRKWMELEDFHLTFCNKKSLQVFKKFNWVENNDYFKSCKIINPLKWIPFFNTLDDSTLNKFNFFKLFNKPINSQNVDFVNLSENINLLINIIDNYKFGSKNNDNRIKILRDKKWLEWRLCESPFIKNYYLFSINESYSIVSLITVNKKKKLNIIFSNYENSNYELLLNQSIVRWSIKNNVDIVWLSVNKLENKNISKKFFNRNFKLTFACNSKDSSIPNEMLKNISDIHGIDSDTDILSYNNVVNKENN
jgi:hypothetical protein